MTGSNSTISSCSTSTIPTSKKNIRAMFEALGRITSCVQYYSGFKLTPTSNFILFLHRKPKHELPSKQTKHRLFQINKEYGNFGKSGERIVVKVRNRDDEMMGGGDETTQDLLVTIAMLEVQKVKVVEYVNEESDNLREVAEKANSELQQIADESIKEMDEAGLKVLENVEAEVRACEEELASERAETKTKEQQIDIFEEQSWEGRNQGLFFKTLFAPSKKWKEIPPDKRNNIQMEADLLKKVTKRTINSSMRRNIYLILILVLSLTLTDAIASGNAEWPKLAVYAVLLVVLVTQLTYETAFSSKDK